MTFVQRWSNVEDVGQRCINVIQMFCVCWDSVFSLSLTYRSVLIKTSSLTYVTYNGFFSTTMLYVSPLICFLSVYLTYILKIIARVLKADKLSRTHLMVYMYHPVNNLIYIIAFLIYTFSSYVLEKI